MNLQRHTHLIDRYLKRLPWLFRQFEKISGGSTTTIQAAKSGYSKTGAFSDKPAPNYIWQANDGIDYDSADIAAGRLKILSLDTSVHNVLDIPTWTTPTPTGNTGIGAFQGAYLPPNVTSLFDYAYDYDAAYPPVINGSTVGYELVGESFMSITSTEFPDRDIHVAMTQVSTPGTGTGLELSLTYKKVGPFNITSSIDPSNPVGTQLWKATTVKSVTDQGTGYVVNQDTITMSGLGNLANATLKYVDPYSATGFEGSSGRIRLNDLEYGDLVKVRLDFNLLPLAANTTVDMSLLVGNRGIIDDFTDIVNIPSQPLYYGPNAVGGSFPGSVEFTKEILSDEDVNALVLPAFKADGPVKLQPLNILTTVIR
jgi:hypothetical protein